MRWAKYYITIWIILCGLVTVGYIRDTTLTASNYYSALAIVTGGILFIILVHFLMHTEAIRPPRKSVRRRRSGLQSIDNFLDRNSPTTYHWRSTVVSKPVPQPALTDTPREPEDKPKHTIH